MPEDKSLFYYGAPYHCLLDTSLAEVRRAVLGLVAQGGSVLDIGCGTGELCFDLREKRRCRVVGVDLSVRMLELARRSRRSADVSFLHMDATDLAGIEADSFDIATIVLLLHELPAPKRARALGEALRVSRGVVVVDAAVPLPRNIEGLVIRGVEYSLGYEHRPHFASFLARGGIRGLLAECGCDAAVVRRELFMHNCREAVLIRGAGQA